MKKKLKQEPFCKNDENHGVKTKQTTTKKKQRKNKRNYAFIVKAIWAFIRLEIFSFSYFIKFFVELFS